MLIEMWYYFFKDNPDRNVKEKLEIIRPLVSLSDNDDDIRIFNFWAKKAGVSEISHK